MGFFLVVKGKGDSLPYPFQIYFLPDLFKDCLVVSESLQAGSVTFNLHRKGTGSPKHD